MKEIIKELIENITQKENDGIIVNSSYANGYRDALNEITNKYMREEILESNHCYEVDMCCYNCKNNRNNFHKELACNCQFENKKDEIFQTSWCVYWEECEK